MKIEKLIETVRLCGSTPKVDQCKQCAYWSGGDMSKCIPRMTTDAATALSTLQAENAQLRADLKYEREHADAYYEECGQWEAENEKLRAELERHKEKNAGLALALLTECAPNPDCLGDNEWRAIRAELEQVKTERDAAVDCIYQIEDDLNRGSDNDWAREHIAEWESHKED